MSISGTMKDPIRPEILACKRGMPLACLTKRDTPMARLANSHCDVLHVGDSADMPFGAHEGRRERVIGIAGWVMVETGATVAANKEAGG